MGISRMMAQGVIALICAGCLAAPAFAADTGFYFGVTGGRADYDFKREPSPVLIVPPIATIGTPLPNLPPPSFGTIPIGGVIGIPVSASFVRISFPNDTRDTAWSTMIGYRIARPLAVEFTYADLGEIESKLEFGGRIVQTESLKTRGLTLAALATLPLRETWDVYARAGAFHLGSKRRQSITVARAIAADDSSGLVVGMGTQYHLKRWSIRLDYQLYRQVGDDPSIGEADIDAYSLGVLYRL